MGFFKVDRSLLEHYLWLEKPFSKGQAWIDLIGLANYEDGKTLYRDKLVICKRGTVYRSISFLAERWGWGREKTRNFLNLLESDNMITVKATTHQTTITIENYGKFQGAPTTHRATDRQQTVQQTDSRPDNERRRIKKNKEGEEVYMGAATHTPPTLEEVTAYCRERGNEIDPERFISYYEQRGWTLSKGQPMKDWKSAVRYWERNDAKSKNKYDNDPRQREGYDELYNEIFGAD